MKNKLIATILIFFQFSFTIHLHSQVPPNICSYNLTNPVFTQIGHVNALRSYAKSPFPTNCNDVVYELDGDRLPNCITDTDLCLNDASSLMYDVYYPIHNYSQQKLPAVILFHGGGFAECPKYSQTIMETLCEEFAKRGFVTFNVEYRRGRAKDLINTANTSVQHQLAAYRGLQDCRGAIRSIIKRQTQHNSDFPDDPYQIDIDNIFIGGVSAGGLMTITSAWYTNPMIYQAFPAIGSIKIQDALGPVDADYYYGEPTIVFKPHVKGILSMWGAIPIPYVWRQNNNEQGFFTQPNFSATLKPVIAFHGALDQTFPYYKTTEQNVIFSPPVNLQVYFNSDSHCLLNSPYTLDDNPDIPDLVSASSLNIYDIAKTINSNLLMEL